MDLRALDLCLAMNTRGDNGVSYRFTWYMFWHSTRGFPRWHWGNLYIGLMHVFVLLSPVEILGHDTSPSYLLFLTLFLLFWTLICKIWMKLTRTDAVFSRTTMVLFLCRNKRWERASTPMHILPQCHRGNPRVECQNIYQVNQYDTPLQHEYSYARHISSALKSIKVFNPITTKSQREKLNSSERGKHHMIWLY